MKKVKLGEAFYPIRNGASIKQDSDKKGYPITRIETISNRVVDRNKMGYAGIVKLDKYIEYVLQNEDILMSHINSETHLGKVALYNKTGDETIIHGMNLLLLRPKREVIIGKYAYYYLSSISFLKQIPNITKKSVNQASFTVTALKELEIPLPSLEKQKEIADRLDKVSSLIEKRKTQLSKLDQLIKSRFIELMDCAELSEEITIEQITERVKVGFVGTCEKYYTDASGIPMLRTGNITDHGIDMSDLKYVTAEFHEKNKKSQIKSGDLLIARHGSNGQANVYVGPEAQCLNAVVIVPNPAIAKSVFLAGLINSPNVKEQIDRTLVGSTQHVVNTKSIANLVVRIPQLIVQEQYEAFVEQVDKSKVEIQKSLEKFETLKKALMQQYFG